VIHDVYSLSLFSVNSRVCLPILNVVRFHVEVRFSVRPFFSRKRDSLLRVGGGRCVFHGRYIFLFLVCASKPSFPSPLISFRLVLQKVRASPLKAGRPFSSLRCHAFQRPPVLCARNFIPFPLRGRKNNPPTLWKGRGAVFLPCLLI